LFEILTNIILPELIVDILLKFKVNNFGSVVQSTTCIAFDTPFIIKLNITSVPLVSEFIVPFITQLILGDIDVVPV
jgi:hypothetical protein